MQLLAADALLTLDGPPVLEGGVLVDAGRIVAVGRAAELQASAERVQRFPGVLMPGFVNAHAHLQYGPGFADLSGGGHAFPDWLMQMNQRRRASNDAAWRAEVAGSWQQARATGTVAVADIVTSPAAFDVPVPGVRYLESVAIASPEWAEECERVERCLGKLPEAGVSPHTLYTLGTDVIAGLIEVARRDGRRLHPHLAETADEDTFVREGAGPFADWPWAGELRETSGAHCSPAHHLDALGGLGPDVHVAHGTHLDAGDRQLLRERGTAVALCARSNATLGSGTPPVAALLYEGSLIAVGTDSLASTPDLDMLSEVRTLHAIATGQGYERDDLAHRLLEAATRGGAYAIGRLELGRLDPGCPAALAHITLDDPTASDLPAEILRSGRAHGVTLEQAD